MEKQAQVLTDRFGRIHDYLRISVTDRCNLRCVYCMPAEGMTFQQEEHLLSFDEIESVVKTLASQGLRRLRLTGGEPLTRRGIDGLIARLAIVPGIEEIAMTTNGMLLAQQAARLKEAGLTRVNISLDSLRADRFAAITRGGNVERVMKAIDESIRVGLKPVKLNVVLMKGYNEDEIEDFLRLTFDRDIQVRFIEYMPMNGRNTEWEKRYLPLGSVLERCSDLGWQVEAVPGRSGSGPAENYRLHGAAGSFGLIHPVSRHFCDSCNRLRLTADGHMKACLYWSDEHQVKPILSDSNALVTMTLGALQLKPKSHEMSEAGNVLGEDPFFQASGGISPNVRSMSQIGG